MEKYKPLITTVIFNIAETVLIFLVGRMLSLPTNNIIIVMLSFMISRGLIGKSLHFKTWYRCLIFSLLILLSLFLILKIDLKVSILFTIFTAFIMTGKSNIKDMYLWSGRTSKYEALKDLVAISPNNTIILENEEYWRKNYTTRFEIFRYYFRENKTYQEIAQIKNFDDNTIIKRECATIYSILEKPLNLPPINR
jgi:hypothetical protein